MVLQEEIICTHILTSLLREVECFYGLALIYDLFVPHRWEWFDTRCSQQFQFNTTPRYFLTCLSKVKLFVTRYTATTSNLRQSFTGVFDTQLNLSLALLVTIMWKKAGNERLLVYAQHFHRTHFRSYFQD